MSGLRTQRRSATRMRIMAAARQIFSDRLYEQSGVRDIATAANVAAGTIIAVFGSKAGLLSALVLEDFDIITKRAKMAVDGVNCLYERLLAMANVAVDYEFKQLGLLRTMLSSTWLHEIEANSEHKQAQLQILKLVAAELSDANYRDEVRAGVDIRLVSAVLLENLLSVFRSCINNECDSAAMMARIDARLKLILGGVLADASKLPA